MYGKPVRACTNFLDLSLEIAMNKKKSAKIRKAPRKSEGAHEPLTQYMKEIGKMKLLTRDEEAELSRRIKEGDTQAMHELVRRNSPKPSSWPPRRAYWSPRR